MLLAALASVALMMSVSTSDAQTFWAGRWRGGYYRPYYNYYRPYTYPMAPSYYYGYYGPSYYPGTSFYYTTPGGVIIR
jgi:hypothetical protein